MEQTPLLRLLALAIPATLLLGCPIESPDDDDVDPATLPTIDHDPVAEGVELTDLPIWAAVEEPAEPDGDGPLAVSLNYKSSDDSDFTSLPMEQDEESGDYGAAIPGDAMSLAGADYWISAQWGEAEATDPDQAPGNSHHVSVTALPLADPAPLRARYDHEAGTVELSWTAPISSAFVGYSVAAELDGGGSETVCQGGDTEGSCTVDAAGVYDLEYATWTVTVAGDGGSGVSATATTDSLHLPLLSFGKEVSDDDPTPFGTAEGEFFLPFAVAVHEGSVHVAEQSNHRLQTFTEEGDFLGFVGALGGSGSPGEADGQFNGPSDVAVSPEGDVYVADFSNCRVQVFDGNTRQFQLAFGELGAAEGQLWFPVSLTFDGEGRLHVAETVNERVSVFDSEGAFLSSYSTDGAPSRIEYLPDHDLLAVSIGTRVDLIPASAEDEVPDPWLLSVGGEASAAGLCSVGWGETLVTLDDPSDTASSDGHRLLRLDSTGSELTAAGEWGVEAGQFWRPVDCTTDPEGNVWVADALNHRIQVLGP